MAEKSVFARKADDEIDGAVIAPHPTCFIDNHFYQSFEDTNTDTKAMKPVEIRSIDASWILKDAAGWKFIHTLSNSENMAYFDLDSIKLLVRY
jgi:elongation factor P hydroxylase